ncbi:SDR family oxidoreductase [Streptacidiphilus carbonis]|uniref:SDR family oxidoreductase n=1 Tax=Streptacidiphilus carbonis TaxID=105422 RepID=UPI000AC66A31|nr:3-beta hydroxysteroid dehydrogenase [Streptacidiphilus carbonis]
MDTSKKQMRVAVAGGTGVVGRLVVAALEAEGHEAVVLSRSKGVDLTTGAGLDRALDGVGAVIDVSNTITIRRSTAVSFFERAAGHLLAAGTKAGVSHHVALSIVGCDRVGLGYYAGKVRQEELVLAGPVPGSVLRATQFHEFAAQLLERGGPMPFVLAPRMRSQPVAASEVATALVELATGDPVGMAPDLAGPEVREMSDLVRAVLRARGSRRPVLSPRLPGAVGRAMLGSGLLPSAPGPRGTQTFEQWLLADTAAHAGTRR